MVPVAYEVEIPDNKNGLYEKFIQMLLNGSQSPEYIAPVPPDIQLKTLYYLTNDQTLVLDFSDRLITQFPSGTRVELEFIYYIVNNICFNFDEIKAVKFLIGGNEYKVLSGHIDMEKPFYPDYRYFKDEQ
ncbi:MAG: GerMN domain-containing protein [bacterium]|nr:GerMN domain-containing protein [bacterium]